jgi:hypothetical protein
MEKKFFIKKEDGLVLIDDRFPLINGVINDTMDRLPLDIAEKNSGDYVNEIYLPREDIDGIRSEVNMVLTMSEDLDLYFESSLRAFRIRTLN